MPPLSRQPSTLMHSPAPFKLPSVTFDLRFEQEKLFRTSYFRNNRACGQKNIRCFPTCNPSAHVDKQFCGRPVVVVLRMCTLQNSPLQLKPRDLHIVANFVTEGTFQAGAPSTIDLETDDVKGQSYFTGRVVRLIAEYSQAEGRVYEFAVEFNSECRGWHYAWNGSRFKTRVEHVLAVHVYTPVIVTSSSDLAPQSSTSTYAKMASFRSVAFKIASLRRKGGVGLQAQGSAEDLSDEIGSSSEGSLENKEETSSVSDPTNGGKRNNLFLSEDLSLSEENKGALKKRPSIPSLPRPCDINNVSTGQIVSVLLPNGVLCDSNAIIVSKNIERKSVVIKYLDSLQVDTVPIERVTATNQSMAQVSAMYRNAALDDGRGTI